MSVGHGCMRVAKVRKTFFFSFLSEFACSLILS